jgi:predicted porin
MLNGLLKVGGVELFGTFETSKGRTKTEVASRKASQVAGDVIYRFGPTENLYVGARYNAAKARLAGMTEDVKINRTALAAGWFLTRNVLVKAEYVVQDYKDFPVADYRNGGNIKGIVVEAVVGF